MEQMETNDNININQETEQREEEKVFLPKKLKVNGAVYYRKDELLKENKDLNEQDIKVLKKASKIKYNPPLSYRWLKIFGLFALVVPFLLIRIIASYPSLGDDLYSIVNDVANALALPLIILAAFIVILKSKEKKQLIITYAFLAVAVYLMLVFLFERYFVILIYNLNGEMEFAEAKSLANSIAVTMKIFQYNIFIDLLLCTTFYYFTNETPKSIAHNKNKMLAFRLCALIPVVYVIVSMILSGLMHLGILSLNVETVGLLTCRSPATYLIFFSISLFISFTQRKYLQMGGTEQGFQEYKKTKGHSLQFSIACSIIIIIACLLDFLFGLIPNSSSFGIGDSKLMFVIIPFVMLISYTKEHKNKTIDMFLPFVAFCLIVFLIIDTVFTLLF